MCILAEWYHPVNEQRVHFISDFFLGLFFYLEQLITALARAH